MQLRRRFLVALICLGLGWNTGSTQPPKDQPKLLERELNTGRELPKGTIARLGSPRLRSHSDYSHGMQFSPNGQLLVLAASRDILWWFDLKTGRSLYQSEYPTSGIQSGRLLDDGSLLFFHSKTDSDTSRHSISKFDPKTKTIISEVRVDVTGVDHSEFDRNGSTLFVQRDKTLSLFNVLTGDLIWSKKLDRKPGTQAAFSPDGARIVLGTDHGLEVIDTKTGQAIRQLDPVRGVSCIVVSNDGRWIATGTSKDQVAILHVESGKVHHELPRQKMPLGFLPDGRLMSMALNGSVGFWSVGTRERICEVPIPVADRVCIAADGKRLATRIHDAVVLYDIPAEGPPTLSPLSAELPGLPDELHFESDGTLVGRLPEFGGWAVWTNRNPKTSLIRPPGTDTVIGLNRDRQSVLTATENHFIISSVDGRHPAMFRYDLSKSGIKRLAALAGDGQLAVAVHEDGLARFDLSTRTDRIIRSRFANRGAGAIAAISADGRLAATEGYDPVSDARHIELFSLSTNRPLREVMVRGPAERLSLTPDGRHLAVAYITVNRDGDQMKNLLVMDSTDGKEFLRLGPMVNASGPRMALAADGRTIAWATEDAILVYELISGQIRSKLALPKHEVHALALDRDGRTVALAGSGWPVILWDMAGETPLEPLTTAASWEAAWSELASHNASDAYRAARRIQLNPTEAVRFLRSKLKPAAPPDAAILAQAIANLDAPAFADRQQASKDIRKFGELAIPELSRVLDATESAEVRNRIESLLHQGQKPTSESIRAVRSVELLEWLQLPESKALLEQLATGAKGALQTREAVAARTRFR